MEKLLTLTYLHRLCSFLFWIFTSIGVLWTSGFLFFIWYVSSFSAPSPPYETTDVLVVFTGGKGRIHVGLSLLEGNSAPLLFISGVAKNVTERDLLLKKLRKISSSSPNISKIILGYHAKNTRENAKEVSFWIHKNRSKISPSPSMRLVTSVYHMPRSLLELQRELPALKIVPHPVFSKPFQAQHWWNTSTNLKLSFSEYIKCNLFFLRIFKEDLDTWMKASFLQPIKNLFFPRGGVLSS